MLESTTSILVLQAEVSETPDSLRNNLQLSYFLLPSHIELITKYWSIFIGLCKVTCSHIIDDADKFVIKKGSEDRFNLFECLKIQSTEYREYHTITVQRGNVIRLRFSVITTGSKSGGLTKMEGVLKK